MHALRKIAQDLQIKGLTEVLKAAINTKAKPIAESVTSPEQNSAKKKRRRLDESENNNVPGETRSIDVLNKVSKAPISMALLPIEELKVEPINDKEVDGKESLHNYTIDKARLIQQNDNEITTVVTSPEHPAEPYSGPTETQAGSHCEKEASTSGMTRLEDKTTDTSMCYQPSKILMRRPTIRDGRCLHAEMTNERPNPNGPNKPITNDSPPHSPSKSCVEDEIIDDYVETWR